MGDRTRWVGVGAATVLAIGSSGARAAYTVTFEQVGSNVIATGEGPLDLAALSFLETDHYAVGEVASSIALEITGPSVKYGSIDVYTGATGPSSFGGVDAGGLADLGSGDLVGVAGNGVYISAPAGYVSGTPLSDSSTYDDETLAGLGLKPGTYIYRWGSGVDAGTFTVQIGAAAPEPSTWAMGLVGLAGTAACARLRKRRPTALRPALARGPAKIETT